MFEPYPDTDPRSWNYERKYNRPPINVTSLLWNIAITISIIALSFHLLHRRLLISAEYSYLLSGVVLVTYCAIRSRDIVIWCIKCYQRFAPISVRCMCRFEPSCSEYMILAIEKFGVVKGVYKGINRIVRCSNKDGGFDFP